MPSPMSGAADVARSGTSRRNQVSTNAAAATGTAPRNTVWKDSTYACRMSACSAAGSRFSAAGLAWAEAGLNPRGSGAPCSAAARLAASRLEKIDPKMATPNEPPMVRKNVTLEVAAPRSA